MTTRLVFYQSVGSKKGKTMSLKTSLGIKNQRIKSKERIIVDAPVSIFEPINPELVALKLKLKEEAQALGERELPKSDQSVRTGTAEMCVDNEVQRVVTEYYEAAISKIQHLEEVNDREKKEVSQKITQTRLLPDQFNQEVNTYLNNNATNFAAIKKEYSLTKQEYETFRQENKLERTANIRSSLHKIFSWVAAIAVILIEVALNYSFFAENLEGGAVAGMRYAFFCSAINVGLAASIGYWIIRNINHVNSTRKAFGWFGVFLAIFCVCMIGFGVGHIRDAMQTSDPMYAAEIALRNFQNGFWKLKDIYSWVLFGLTVLFGSFACIDGYCYDDPYPGYSKIAQKFNQISEDWAGELEARRNDINEIQKDFVERITTQVHACDNGLECINKTKLDKEQTLLAYDAALRSADKAFQTLVSLFRSENTKYRSTSAPAYYEDPIILDLQKLPPVVVADDDQLEVEMLKTEVKRLHSETQGIRQEIIKAFNDQEAKIQLEKEKMNV